MLSSTRESDKASDPFGPSRGTEENGFDAPVPPDGRRRWLWEVRLGAFWVPKNGGTSCLWSPGWTMLLGWEALGTTRS